MTVRGSIEIISNGISTGMTVNVRSVEAIPVVVEHGHSLTDVQPVAEPREGVDAAWTATTANGFPAEVLWRQERDLTLREIADAIDAAESEG